MLICQARIIKEYKSRKADCMWPESVYGPNDVGTLPLCGGAVNVRVKAVAEPDWGGTYPKIEIDAKCSKCNWPWWPGRIAWENAVMDWAGWDITTLLEERLIGLEHKPCV